MADEDTTSVQPQDNEEEVGELASDEATGNTPGTAQAEEETEASTEDEESKPSEESEEEPEAKADADADDNSKDDFKDWAAKKKLPLDDPEKLGRMYRELETKLGSDDRKNQLKQAVESANSETGVSDVDALNNRIAALEFYVAHPEAQSYEQQMVDILEEKPWLAGDLETVLLAAKGASSTEAEKLAAERQAGKKEALATAAQADRAAPPRASATTRATPKQVTDADVGNMTPDEYNEWRKDNNPFSVAV